MLRASLSVSSNQAPTLLGLNIIQTTCIIITTTSVPGISKIKSKDEILFSVHNHGDAVFSAHSALHVHNILLSTNIKENEAR